MKRMCAALLIATSDHCFGRVILPFNISICSSWNIFLRPVIIEFKSSFSLLSFWFSVCKVWISVCWWRFNFSWSLIILSFSFSFCKDLIIASYFAFTIWWSVISSSTESKLDWNLRMRSLRWQWFRTLQCDYQRIVYLWRKE